MSVFADGGGRLLKVHEVAERLGVHRRTVDRMIAAGELVKVKVRRGTRIPEASLMACIQRNTLRSDQP